ncbi:MAG: VWA domain-containing protein [Hymenobacter sp.]
MEIEDLKPTRLAAAKRLAGSFVRSRAGDRLGLVAFAGQAYSLVPLTTDYDLLLDNLASLQPRPDCRRRHGHRHGAGRGHQPPARVAG